MVAGCNFLVFALVVSGSWCTAARARLIAPIRSADADSNGRGHLAAGEGAASSAGTERSGFVSKVLEPLEHQSSGGDAASATLDDSSSSRERLNVLREVQPTNTTQADVVRVRLNAHGDGQALIGSLLVSGGGALLIGILFTLVRYCNPAVYAREGACVDGPAWSWWWPSLVWATTPDDEVQAAGLDGWSLLEFYRLNIQILWTIGPPIVCMLCPLHFVANTSTPDFLSRFDIGSIPDKSALYWVHAGFVWFVVLAVSFCVLVAHRRFLSRRFRWLHRIPQPQATTIMVENIPEALRSDLALKDYFSGKDGLFVRNSQIVEDAYIVRKTSELRSKWERLQELRKAVSLAKSRHRDGALSPGEQENLDALVEALQAQDSEVATERLKVENAVVERDPEVCSSSGFVTFSSVLWQRLALKEDFRADKSEFIVSMPPDPSDVVYDNLMVDSMGSHTWEWVGWLCLLGLFIGWSPIVVFISSWTTLSAIEEYVPLASELLRVASGILPVLPSLLEGVLATAALRLFLAFLPAILFQIITSFFSVKAGVVAQFRLSRWYFSFLLIFVLLVTTLGRSLVVTAVALARDPTRIIDLLAVWLPRTSHYYFNYMIMGWLTLVWEMTRFANLTVYISLAVLQSSGPAEAKHFSEPENAASYGMGSRMGLASLMSAITLVFCTCSPLMLVFSLVYFSIGKVAYGYLLVHAESKKPDSGGRFWVEAMRQICFILALFVLLMTGVLLAGFNTFWSGPALVTLSALFAVYMLWSKIHSYEWETLPLEELMKVRPAAFARELGTSEPVPRAVSARLSALAEEGKAAGSGLGSPPPTHYRQPECEVHSGSDWD